MTSNNSPSERIIKTKAKRAEVQASPGSGKTHILIQRLQHLVSTGVSAEQILVLSFSNSTVKEIRHRMGAILVTDNPTRSAGTALSKVTVKTAHSFSRSLIKKQEVLTKKQADAILGKAIKLARQDCRKGLLWPDISLELKQRRLQQLEALSDRQQIRLVLNFLAVAHASRKKVSDTASISQFVLLKPYVKVLRAVRIRFKALKKAKGVIDYGDMLSQAVIAIEGGASVPYTHILVDEYQDCSPAQTQLLAQLGKLDGRSIMVFGDRNQGIFGFAGGGYMPLSNVLDGVQELTLPTSWRLTAQTAALASAVAQLDTEQAIQTRREGELPVLISDSTLDKQTKHIVQDIQTLIDGGTPPEQIAVLARTKALLAPVEQLLLARNVKTKRMGTLRNRKHALRVLKLVRMVERCEQAKEKVMPEMLIKALPLIKGVDDTVWKKESLKLKKVYRVPSLEGRYRQCAGVYLRLMGGVRKNSDLRTDVNRWESLCRGHNDSRAMCAAVRATPYQGVVTGTIHSAKGGEWDHVLVVGVTDGLLPLYLNLGNDLLLVEERNLLYVAITRARETVRLYHAPANHARSRKRFEDLSRFLEESAVRKTLRVE